MEDKWYAIVFTKEFPSGEHWDSAASPDDSDRKQPWKVGDLWSVGTVVSPTLPSHLKSVELPHPPDFSVERWDPATQQLVPHDKDA